MGRYVFIFCCLLLTACKKESVEQSLEGRWEWQETHFNWRGTTPYTLTPSSTDTSMVVHITPTNIEIYKNGIFFGEYSYSASTSLEDKKILAIAYGNMLPGIRVEQGPVTFENGKLYIAGGYNDAGGTQIFTRLR